MHCEYSCERQNSRQKTIYWNFSIPSIRFRNEIFFSLLCVVIFFRLVTSFLIIHEGSRKKEQSESRLRISSNLISTTFPNSTTIFFFIFLPCKAFFLRRRIYKNVQILKRAEEKIWNRMKRVPGFFIFFFW
jgi:hypothetical protein